MADISQFVSNFFSPSYTKSQGAFQSNVLAINQVVLPLFLFFVASRIVKYRQNIEDYPVWSSPRRGGTPGTLLYGSGEAVFLQVYKYYGNDTISVVSFGPSTGGPGFYSANLDVARQVTGGGHKSSFIKPETASRGLLLWGMNLVAADKETWRKHRRIMGPAFNNKLYEMVWKETLNTYREMISAEGWRDKTEIEIPVIQTLTFKLALLIIGKCGFGFAFNWFNPPKSDDGKMSVQAALKVVSESHMFHVLLPEFVKNLPFKRLQESKEAHQQLMTFMHAQVTERKAEIASGGSTITNDVFTMLVKANENENVKFQLDDQELVGNVFIMLFAGHDTTGHTLAATLGFLSLHENIQQEVYEQIISVVGLDRDPVYGDYDKLDKVLAVFYEALRMFPSGHVMVREAYEDTTLQIPNPHGHEGLMTIPVRRGMQVVIDMIGIQYNPRYFDSPNEYRPSRWYGAPSDWSQAFTAFSIGPRECIGRKFATTEAVCFLTLLLRDFTIHPIKRPGETKEAWRDRVLDARLVMTLGVADVPVKFVRRSTMI